MFETVYSPIFIDNPTFCCTLSLRVAIGIPYLLEAALYVSFLFLISAICTKQIVITILFSLLALHFRDICNKLLI